VDLHDGIAVGDIARTGLGTATADAIVRGILDGTYKDVHGVLLYQHGRLVMEEYFYGYNVQRAHQLRSATKSVVATLAGIAVDRGALTGSGEVVLPHMSYPSYAHPDPRKATITLGNFLSMRSGLDCNDHSGTSPGRETVIDDTPDWVKATLDLPMINDPGTKAYYCSGGVAVVGRLIENVVHTSLPEFAQANLFAPLAISRAQWQWNYDLTNVSYGYFWWRPWLNVETAGGAQHVDVIAAQGNGGQKIYLVPQYDLVAVFTAGGYNAESTPPNTIMAKIILPALMAAHPHDKR
jgi:CubicO group peptidase (beta-lactamase class C family)